jgi:hypothetical protein
MLHCTSTCNGTETLSEMCNMKSNFTQLIFEKTSLIAAVLNDLKYKTNCVCSVQ